MSDAQLKIRDWFRRPDPAMSSRYNKGIAALKTVSPS
jgi:hypothetical protein